MWITVTKACAHMRDPKNTPLEEEVLEPLLISHGGFSAQQTAEALSFYRKWKTLPCEVLDELAVTTYVNNNANTAKIVASCNPLENGKVRGLAAATGIWLPGNIKSMNMYEMAKSGKTMFDGHMDGSKCFSAVDGRAKVTVKVKVLDLASAIKRNNDQLAANKMFVMFGVLGSRNEVCMASWAILAMTHPRWTEIVWVLWQLDAWSLDDKTLLSELKELHDEVRNRGTLMGLLLNATERRELQYLNEVMGRGLWSMDFTEELKMREGTIPEKQFLRIDSGELVVLKEQFDSILEASVMACLEVAMTGLSRRSCKSFSEWMDDRYRWGASGSAPGARVEYDLGNKRIKTAATKRTWLETVTAADGWSWLEKNRPHIKTTFVPKFENGKNRALSNTANWEYVFEAFLLDGVEQRLARVHGAIMKEGGLTECTRIEKRLKALNARFGWSYDYKSFENNHNFKHMAMLWKHIGKVRAGHARTFDREDVALEYERVGDWLEKAVSNVYMRDMVTGLEGKANFGLVTGTRGTAFVNTMLNKVYCTVMQLALMSAVQQMPEEWAHMGDDVLATTESYTTAHLMTGLMTTMGLVTNKLKTLVEYGSGELLRKWYSADGEVSGYLTRMVPNIAAGEWDLSGPATPYEKVGAGIGMLRKMQARGANSDHMATLLDAIRFGPGAVKRQGKRETVPVSYLFSAAINGGRGIRPLKGVTFKEGVWHTASIDNFTKEMEFGISHVPQLATESFRNKLSLLGLRTSGNVADKLVRKELLSAYTKTFPKPWVDRWYEKVPVGEQAFKWLGHADSDRREDVEDWKQELLGTIGWMNEIGLEACDRWLDKLEGLTSSAMMLEPANLDAIKTAVGAGQLPTKQVLDNLHGLLQSQHVEYGPLNVSVLRDRLGDDVARVLLLQEFTGSEIVTEQGEDAAWALAKCCVWMALWKNGPYETEQQFVDSHHVATMAMREIM
ncbi:MAG: putative RNA dependent RNA polymerase [Utsjoki toti-like virus]|nr:MAG: putative RNA dependent RNA polymerase [Utsjoki toti-like virus]